MKHHQNQVSDNKYFNCPAKMSDGRHFTDYHPRCFQTKDYTVGCKQLNSYEYRQYLIANGELLIEKNRNNAYDLNKCETCGFMFGKNDTMAPEQNVTACNKNICKIIPFSEQGIGMGRLYDSS